MNKIKNSIKILIVVVLLSIVFSFMDSNGLPFFRINDNQKLYFYSTGAQVLAGMFSIIIAAYVFFIDKLNREVEEDDSLYDVVKEIKIRNYHKIIHMGVILFVTLLCCFTNIIIKANETTFFVVFISFMGLFFIFYELLYIIIFAILVVEPGKIEKTSQRLKENEDDKGSMEKEAVELGEFLKEYNTLEMVITDAASYLDGWSERWAEQTNKPPQMMQALQFLVQKNCITEKEANRINEIRRYRNLSVHSISNEKVNKDIYNEVQYMIKLVVNRMHK
ncbi:hypothetical protein IA831_00690 [Listeria marthii]|uniref:hypothetical protein n=1 Tax=Listeria marthii TaxID=529731 RepID=UPI001887340B|nr:hypothetical protein [Listeria marthii]MBF2392069.1 hypothetical protein [Listeria marthii]